MQKQDHFVRNLLIFDAFCGLVFLIGWALDSDVIRGFALMPFVPQVILLPFVIIIAIIMWIIGGGVAIGNKMSGR